MGVKQTECKGCFARKPEASSKKAYNILIDRVCTDDLDIETIVLYYM